MTKVWSVLCLAAVPLVIAAQAPGNVLDVLPETATTQLARSLEAASGHRPHVWKDTPAVNDDGSVNGYVEIARGDLRKWEFDMRLNARAIDRMIPADIGGYPVNYGFVPQTISYDGDPFDVLVLGPPLSGGTMVRGIIVGLLLMEDEKGLDSKVVVSPVGPNGRPLHQLGRDDQQLIGDYFKRYKDDQPGKFSKVPGWGSVADGRALVTQTHRFFQECRGRAGARCQVPRKP